MCPEEQGVTPQPQIAVAVPPAIQRVDLGVRVDGGMEGQAVPQGLAEHSRKHTHRQKNSQSHTLQQ